VLEIVRGVAGHVELFHHAPRAPVRRNRECDDFRQLQFVEPELQNGLRAFRGQAMSPGFRGQTPADLDARSERRLKGCVDHSDEADELGGVAQFCGEEGEAVLCLMGLNAINEGIGLLARKWRGEVFHYARIGVDAVEWLTVLVAPVAEAKARGFNHFVSAERSLAYPRFGSRDCPRRRPYWSEDRFYPPLA